LAIMSVVESRIVPGFSFCVVLYSLITLEGYFNLVENRFLDVVQSYFTTLFLSAIAFICMMTSISNGNGLETYGVSFLLLSLTLLVDGFYGLSKLLDSHTVEQTAESEEDKKDLVR